MATFKFYLITSQHINCHLLTLSIPVGYLIVVFRINVVTIFLFQFLKGFLKKNQRPALLFLSHRVPC